MCVLLQSIWPSSLYSAELQRRQGCGDNRSGKRIDIFRDLNFILIKLIPGSSWDGKGKESSQGGEVRCETQEGRRVGSPPWAVWPGFSFPSQPSLMVPSRENEENSQEVCLAGRWEEGVDSGSLYHSSAASWFQVIKPQEPRWPPAGLCHLPPTNTTAPFAKCSRAAEPQGQGEDVTEKRVLM